MSAASPKPHVGRKQGILLGLERFSRQHYKIVFLAAAVLIVLGSWLGSRLSIDSDILELIPEGNPQVDGFKRAVSDFGSISFLIALVDAGESGAGADELEDFADIFAEKLQAMPDLVERVEYRLDPGASFLEVFYDNALMYLAPERLGELEAKLEDDAIGAQMEQNRLSLSSPTAAFTQDLMINDPLGLMPLFFGRADGRAREPESRHLGRLLPLRRRPDADHADQADRPLAGHRLRRALDERGPHHGARGARRAAGRRRRGRRAAAGARHQLQRALRDRGRRGQADPPGREVEPVRLALRGLGALLDLLPAFRGPALFQRPAARRPGDDLRAGLLRAAQPERLLLGVHGAVDGARHRLRDRDVCALRRGAAAGALAGGGHRADGRRDRPGVCSPERSPRPEPSMRCASASSGVSSTSAC